MLGRKPAELLKLISRLDSLSSDDHKSKVADKYPKLFKAQGVMKDSYCITLKLRGCQTVPSVSAKESALPLVSGNKRRVRQDVGGRCHIQS